MHIFTSLYNWGGVFLFIYTTTKSNLYLTFPLLRNFYHHLAPSTSAPQALQGLWHALQPHKLLIPIHRAAKLALLDQLEDAIPHHGDRLLLVCRVGPPVQADNADVLQQHLVHRDLLNRAGGEANDQDLAVPRNALGGFINHADGVVDDIHASLLRRQVFDRRRPRRIRVVHDMVGTIRLRNLELVFRARGSDHRGPKRLCYLHGGQPNTTGGGVHQHPVALLDARPRNQRSVAGGSRDEQASCVGKTPPLRHRVQHFFSRRDLGGITSLRCPEYFVSDLVFGLRDAGGHGEDDARELGAGDPGKGRLMLVFAGDLQEVKEIGRGSVDGD